MKLQMEFKAKEQRHFKLTQQPRLKTKQEKIDKLTLEKEIETLRLEINILKRQQRDVIRW